MPFSPRLCASAPPLEHEDALDASQAKLIEEKAARKAARKAEREAAAQDNPRLCVSVPPQEPQGAQDVSEAKLIEEKAARKAARKAQREADAEEAEAIEAKLIEEKLARKAARKAARASEAVEKEEQEMTTPAKAACASDATITYAEPVESSPKRKSKEQAEVAEGGAKLNAKARRAALRAAKFGAAVATEQFSASGKEEGATAPQKRKRDKAEDGFASSSTDLSIEAYRTQHEIAVESGCPPPFQSFASAAPIFGKALSKALLAQGYLAPTPIQAQAWPIALSGQDMVAVAKTGSGKTCGFLLPALARIAARGPAPVPKKISFSKSEPATPSVLVLAPTRELALQILSEAEKFLSFVKARAVVLYGGTSKGPQIGELRKGADIIIATPGRLLDFSEGVPGQGITSPISLASVSYLVLDEADQMLDMGFEKDIRKIVDKCKPTGAPEQGGGAGGSQAGSRRQTLFFTATWPEKVKMTAASLTSSSAVQVRIGQGGGGSKLTANKNVSMEFIVCEWKEKVGKLKEYLSASLGQNENTVVFAATKGACDFLERELVISGTWCQAIHGDKEQWQREKTLGEFRAHVASGQRAILVATDVAARGLDIPGISLVVVYDFGNEKGGGAEPWVHRIGRTGRAGKKGRALTFYTADDKGAAELVQMAEEANQKVPDALKEMASWTVKKRRVHGFAKKWAK